MYHNIDSVPSYTNEISAQIVLLPTMKLLHPAFVVTFRKEVFASRKLNTTGRDFVEKSRKSTKVA
jgi:hypothetical protein